MVRVKVLSTDSSLYYEAAFCSFQMDPQTSYLRNVAHMFYDAPVESISCDHIVSLTVSTSQSTPKFKLLLFLGFGTGKNSTVNVCIYIVEPHY